MDDPVFILGTERSGSNLLRLILDAHPHMVVPHPPHVVRYFAPLEARYGDLREPARLRGLVEDVLALVAAHIHPWPWIPAPEAVIERVEAPSVMGVYVALHEALRAHVGKARWGCKSTFMVEHVPALRALRPGARFLWLHRDVRDVAASSKESVFSTFVPAFTARLWVRQQALAAAAEAGGGVLRVPYEALVADAEGQVRRICAFLDEPFAPEMLRWFEGEAARTSASLSESWRHTAAPMQSSRLARYRKDLSATEVAEVEELAGATMVQLGYAPEGPAQAPPSGLAAGLREVRWAVEDDVLALRVELRSAVRDRNVRLRWRRYWLMQRIRARLVLRGR